MNVYEKLQNCRVKLQKSNLKKSGQNKFAGYSYYELGDFLPTINDLMLELKLCSSISFNSEMAILEIINIEKPEEKVTFTSPLADAQLKGCHPVQNLGAVQTYIRRYLYTNAFEIVEHDALDGTIGKPVEDKKDNNPQQQQPPKQEITEGQIKRLFAIANSKGYSKEVVMDGIVKRYKKQSVKELTKTEYDEVCNGLEKQPNKAS